MKHSLILKNIRKTFTEDHGRRVPALENIDLEIGEGEFFIFVGPSGCGKSTLLRIASGLERDYGGEVVLGEHIKPSDTGFVFQQFALLPWLTVYQNVELGLLSRNIPEREKRHKIEGVLGQLGLEKAAHNYPRELSGGMRQRTGLARAIVIDPKIIFMDEPFSEVDSFTAETLRQLTLDMWRDHRPTIVMVTHLIPEALQLADRIAIMTPAPGRIEKVIHNPLPRPRDKRSKEFFTLEDELTKLIKP